MLRSRASRRLASRRAYWASGDCSITHGFLLVCPYTRNPLSSLIQGRREKPRV